VNFSEFPQLFALESTECGTKILGQTDSGRGLNVIDVSGALSTKQSIEHGQPGGSRLPSV
jgi:hypothetical protein